MRTTMWRRTVSVLLVGLAAASVSGIGAHAAEKAKIVKALTLAKSVDASKPDAEIWAKVPVTKVSLQPAFPGHVAIVGAPRITELAAQAVRTRDTLFVRLAWDDPAPNTERSNTSSFLDGAAIQFPVNGKTSTTPFMGDAKNPVNVWYWRADGRAENLVAGGFGTLDASVAQNVAARGARSARGWEVVLARKLSASPTAGVDLGGRRKIPIAFAAWDGANQERDGFKAVTLEWWRLRF